MKFHTGGPLPENSPYVKALEGLTIEKGKVYTAKNQGTAITPQTVQVVVDWVDGVNVHYRIVGRPWERKQTPIERFKEIVGA
jgi:hypothetical protein